MCLLKPQTGPLLSIPAEIVDKDPVLETLAILDWKLMMWMMSGLMLWLTHFNLVMGIGSGRFIVGEIKGKKAEARGLKIEII